MTDCSLFVILLFAILMLALLSDCPKCCIVIVSVLALMVGWMATSAICSVESLRTEGFYVLEDLNGEHGEKVQIIREDGNTVSITAQKGIYYPKDSMVKVMRKYREKFFIIWLDCKVYEILPKRLE